MCSSRAVPVFFHLHCCCFNDFVGQIEAAFRIKESKAIAFSFSLYLETFLKQ